MDIYLPIAEIPINVFLLLALGMLSGLLSGLFGIGGGFILTPFLIFAGIPPTIAVASSANAMVGSSFSAFLIHYRKKNVDFQIGFIFIIGGFLGSSFGIILFKKLNAIGQIDLVISLAYIFILGIIGVLMAIESIKSLFSKKNFFLEETNLPNSKEQEGFFQKILKNLPFQCYFSKSQIKISLLIPLAISFFSGILVTLMGIGGGFILIPAMIYLLRMPTTVVIGTSLLQIIFTASNVTILQSVVSNTVDIVLVSIILLTSIIGAQYGTKLSLKISPEKLRAMLAIIILIMVTRLVLNFILVPDSAYTIKHYF